MISLFTRLKEDKILMDYCYEYIDKVHQYIHGKEEFK